MDPPPEDDQRLKRKRPLEPEDDDPGSIPGSSRGADEQQRQDRSSGSMDDPASECKHRIFLSHSGHDKDFVEELCGDLERCYRFPFFDKCSSSLPKGERFPELILAAARSCEMGVVVVSDEYFMSKWPMIELDAFVQTWLMRKKCNMETKLKILPLFYGLSVLEFGKEERRAKWFSKWEDLANGDPRIDVDRWKRSLRVLALFNGIVYDGGSRKKAYRDEVVEQICNEVPPDVKWDDSHVQGGSKICQVIEEAILGIQPSRKYGARVVGVYGVGGMGKTTLCRSLGNRLSQKNNMKASHVELGSKSYGELLKEVLKDCTNTNEVFLQRLDEGKCRNILLKEACKQKVFLAIDNVWPNSKSLEDAKKFLQLGFHNESIVLVTSRALETLTSLGISRCDCFEMPCLDDEDAKNLFLYHAAYGIQFPDKSDKQAIESCVDLCYFRKGNWSDGHYLPLALKALGIQLGCIGSSPSEWVKALPRVRDFNYLQEEENPVFSILRSSFDCLRPMQQSLLLDLVVFAPKAPWLFGERATSLIKWLALVHNQSVHEIETMVLQLKKRGLVEAIDVDAQEVYIHDVYREFAQLEAEMRLKDLAFEERKWVSCVKTFPIELLEEHGCWKNLTRFKIAFVFDKKARHFNRIERVKWANCSNIVVLELRYLRGSLDLKGLRCLKSLQLFDVYQLEGLQDLTALNYFLWQCYDHFDNFDTRVYTQKFPPSLKILLLKGQVSLSAGALDMCVNLATLRLENCFVENLDFKSCSSLQNVDILEVLPDLETDLDVSLCNLQELKNLTHLRLESYEVETVYKLDWLPTSLRVLEMDRVLLLGIGARNECNDLTKLIFEDIYEDYEDSEALPTILEVMWKDVRMSFGPDAFTWCINLTRLELRNCSAKSLNFTNCSSLQSLKLLNVCPDLEAMSDLSVCGLQNIGNLIDFELVYVCEDFWCRMDQLPASLQVVKIKGDVLSKSGLFNRCINLTKLKLWYFHDQSLDFKKYSSLEQLELDGPLPCSLEGMLDWSLWGLQELSNLTYFRWSDVDNHEEFYKMGQLPMVSLKDLKISAKVLLRPDVVARCTKLSNLVLENCHAEILDFSYCTSLERVTLQEVEHLQTILGLRAASASLYYLKVDGCDNLEGILELPDLVCLRFLGLLYLGGLPNMRLSCLSGLTKLETLDLMGSNVELREEDVCTLASLPLLHSVIVIDWKIDVVRRKLLRYHPYLEKDLGMLPIWTIEL